MNPEKSKIEETPEKSERGYPIERVCYGCNKTLGFKDGGTEPGQKTHDLCPECFKKQYGVELKDHGVELKD